MLIIGVEWMGAFSDLLGWLAGGSVGQSVGWLVGWSLVSL
jgi:hypothetical protein